MTKIKFLLANKGKGTIDLNNPIVEEDLFLIEEPAIPFIETDPTVPSHVKAITPEDIALWNQPDQNTTYNAFTRSVAGLVPAPGGATLTRYLREDGTWGTPPDTDTIYTHPDKAWVDKTPLSGANVISNIVVDAKGHPTGWTTRTIIPGDIGAALASHTHNYEVPLTFVGEGATTVSRVGSTITISSTDTQGTGADGNNYVISGSYNNSTEQLTLNRQGLTDVVIPLSIPSYSFNLAVNNDVSTVIDKDENIRFKTLDTTVPLEWSRNGNEIYLDRIPKKNITRSEAVVTPNATTAGSARYWQNQWVTLTGTDPVISLNGINVFPDGFEIEGTFDGTGTLTINSSNGITLVYPTTYFTNTYPKGGVFGIKFVTPTKAHIFGTLKPIGV